MMVRLKDIEEVFLGVLREDNNRDEIKQKIQKFADTDWQALLDFSAKNGLFPIFYNQLSRLNLENIPSEFLSKFKNLCIFNLKRNIILERELFKIISVFKEANIPAIPLKGPVLTRYLYRDLALRQTSVDLDLLVKEETFKKAQDILRGIGYHLAVNEDTFLLQYRRTRAVSLVKQESEYRHLYIDLHWDLRFRFIQTHIQYFWQNARKINLDGYDILFPSDEDLLLYLTLNAISVYGYVQLKYLYDTHSLINSPAKLMDWQLLAQRAKDFHFDCPLFLALRLCKEFFHTPLPDEILGSIMPSWGKRNFCRLWVNKTNIFRFRTKIASSCNWRILVSTYIYSHNILAALSIVYKRVFLPMEEVMGFSGHPLGKVSYAIYIRRLLKPFSSLFSKKRFLKNVGGADE